MKKFNFTIFTPLHNGAKTIHRVFNSLKNSTYSNFEWIVVNDGSTDETLYIANKYQVSFDENGTIQRILPEYTPCYASIRDDYKNYKH